VCKGIFVEEESEFRWDVAKRGKKLDFKIEIGSFFCGNIINSESFAGFMKQRV